jgi:catechol 1,2-dioxygenase
MLRSAAIAAAILAVAIARPAPSAPGLVGTWQLVSRTDRDPSGRVLSAAGLGEAPIGYLIYDAAGHVSAQLAARDRTGLVCDSTGLSPDPNNNANISGYSAYFGRYEINASAGTVTHILEGTLSPADAGKRLWRRFRIVGDTLTISFEPLGPDGTPRNRTLIWHRVSS